MIYFVDTSSPTYIAIGTVWELQKEHKQDSDEAKLAIVQAFLDEYERVNGTDSPPAPIVLELLADFLLHRYIGNGKNGDYLILSKRALERRQEKDLKYIDEAPLSRERFRKLDYLEENQVEDAPPPVEEILA